jgi:hypothetical protein
MTAERKDVDAVGRQAGELGVQHNAIGAVALGRDVAVDPGTPSTSAPR